ncbi:MAG: lamin tail domain-containing protein [Candidatus Limimorpha sp.]
MNVKILTLLSWIILLIPYRCMCQIYDDFSDGDFTCNPSWFGTDSLFIVNDKHQLQLNAEAGGKAWLFSNINYSGDDFEWSFYLREAFSPSGMNFSDVYLCDNYYLNFGEAGSEDVVALYRVDNESHTCICRGVDTFIASSFSAYFKVTRTAGGLWKIFVDKTGEGDYVVEAQCFDDIYLPSGNFGIVVTFTSSNAKKVFLDDVYAGPLIIDHEPPVLQEIVVINEHTLNLVFDEPLEQDDALICDNYLVDNLLGSPSSCVSIGSRTVSLSFENLIEERRTYTLNIAKISDISGNALSNFSYTFFYVVPHEFDLVINEIMADPEPSCGLPPYEYIELYNTSDWPLNLKNWKLIIGTSEKSIDEDLVVPSDGYVLLCKNSSIESLQTYGQCYGFTSFSINNSGADISVIDDKGVLISNVDFSLSWYRDSGKIDGGFSLEQINSQAACAGKMNWRASAAAEGGTPCAINSVNDTSPVAPTVEFVDVPSPNTLIVYFSQIMNRASMEDIGNYAVVEFDSNPVAAECSLDSLNRVRLVFNRDFEKNRVYNIEFYDLCGCYGNMVLPDYRFSFGITDDAMPGDAVINEVLFNPVAPAGDYVEIYNSSEKILNVKDLKIASVRTTFPNPPDTMIKNICNEDRLFLPDTYLLLTTTPEIIGNQYCCSTDNFIFMESFPTLPNESAEVLLLSDENIVDMMSYSEKMHFPLLVVTKGVALERVSSVISSLDEKNWHSSAAPLYGTPGYNNSVCSDNMVRSDDVNISPEVFSPDGDGFDDVSLISYRCDKEGFMVKIMILDAQGRLVRDLVNCESVGIESHFVWDGLDDASAPVAPGIYVVLTEAFDLDGRLRRYKNAVVVAHKK